MRSPLKVVMRVVSKVPDDLHYMNLDEDNYASGQERHNTQQENQECYYEARSKSRKMDRSRSFEGSRKPSRKRDRKYNEYEGSFYENRGSRRVVNDAADYNSPQRRKKYVESYQQRGRRFTRPTERYNTYRRDYGRSRFRRSGQSSEVIFYIILFILVAVLFKYVILKSVGMTAVAAFVIILTVVGHIRDK